MCAQANIDITRVMRVCECLSRASSGEDSRGVHIKVGKGLTNRSQRYEKKMMYLEVPLTQP